MSFPEDLLQQAYDLADKEPAEPKQASLRRAVSTAYYALFHLLIDESVSKWAVERQRSILARTFAHDRMRKVCDGVVKGVKDGAALPDELNTVARNFIQLQDHRHAADYDNSEHWSRTDVKEVLTLATDAFRSWASISAQDAAQDFLLQLFLQKPPRRITPANQGLSNSSRWVTRGRKHEALDFDWRVGARLSRECARERRLSGATAC